MDDIGFDYDGGGATWGIGPGRWLKIGLLIFVLLIMSMWAACSEIRYLAFGKVTAATVRHSEVVVKHSRRSAYEYLQVRYSFKDDDGEERIEGMRTDKALLSNFAKGTKFDVQYIPRRIGESRQMGHNNWWMTLPLVICILATAGFVFWMHRDVQKYERAVARTAGRI